MASLGESSERPSVLGRFFRYEAEYLGYGEQTIDC